MNKSGAYFLHFLFFFQTKLLLLLSFIFKCFTLKHITACEAEKYSQEIRFTL